MIEIAVLDYLSARLPVDVYMEVPPAPPRHFVVLRKGGSSRENYMDTAIFTADSYAPTLLEAAMLNQQVMTVMDSLTELDIVSAAKRSGNYPFPDTASKRYRYQAVYDITHY